MWRAEPLLSFQHRHSTVARKAGSTLCQGIRSPAVSCGVDRPPAADRLGRPAMVEYRHDPATGQSWLMEINGRFWSLPLASHGAEFADDLRRVGPQG
jgi:hypothetical protein